MNSMKYHIVLERQEEGGYTAYVPELPGCISQGDTEKETIENISEAISLYEEELASVGTKYPLPAVKIIEPSHS